MSASHPDASAFVLSSSPYKVTVGDLKTALTQNDAKTKKYVAKFIAHRLSQQYIVPLLQVPKAFRSGFLMMASACLMIETMECFHKGRRDVKSEGKRVFKDFFTRERRFFPGFADDNDNFYAKIRGGILHQAGTKGGYRIMKKGPLLDVRAKRINATKFLKALKRCLENYVSDLKATGSNDAPWLNAMKKVAFIAEDCIG